jgi:hypothetical protein
MTLLVKDQRMGVRKEEKKRLKHFAQRRDCIGIEFGRCIIKTRRAYWTPILQIFMEHVCTAYSLKFNGKERVQYYYIRGFGSLVNPKKYQTISTLAARGLEELFFSCAVVSVFWFLVGNSFGVTYLRIRNTIQLWRCVSFLVLVGNSFWYYIRT